MVRDGCVAALWGGGAGWPGFGSYPNQSEPMQSVGSWSYVVARTSLPDEIAYKLIRAVHKGEGALAKRLAQAAETTAANTANGVARQDMLHPGVLRYLREVGILK